MEMKVGLTYACMNLKNLAKILAKKEQKAYDMLHSLIKETRKVGAGVKLQHQLCLQSESRPIGRLKLQW